MDDPQHMRSRANQHSNALHDEVDTCAGFKCYKAHVCVPISASLNLKQFLKKAYPSVTIVCRMLPQFG